MTTSDDDLQTRVHTEQGGKLKRETEQAWENFQKAGRYPDAGAVEDWLDSWGTEDEQPAPACE